jgi:N-acetylglucosaminyl-diphospho-decaprenol L-rhamnosyltransferase
MTQDVGVVIATRNRERSLQRTLVELLALPERPPIVLVDNGSTDDTVAVARAAGVRVIALGENIGPAARTVGVRALDTEAIAFADDDSWWAPGALAAAVALLREHPHLALIAARILVGEDERLDPTCAEMARSPLAAASGLPGRPVLGFIACGAVVRRAAYLEVGGFERRFGFGGEEQLLALDLAAAGWQLAYVPEIVAHHHPSRAAAGRDRRPATEVRNLLWSTWLRRALGPALATTVRVGVSSVLTGQGRAVVQALRGLPWALRRRRPLPWELERAVQRLG